jgi:hypothetical protein
VKLSNLTPPNYERIDKWLQLGSLDSLDTPAYERFAACIDATLAQLVARWESKAAPQADRGLWQPTRDRG